VIHGANNWLPKRSNSVPSGWQGTIFGADPMFENLAAFDLRPALDSPLRDAAAPMLALENPPAFAFPRPLGTLNHQPPVRGQGGRILARRSDGKPDIGAYEGGFEFTDEVADGEAATRSVAIVGFAGSLGPARPNGGGGRCGCSTPGAPASSSSVWWIAMLGGLVGRRFREGKKRQ
jgi:MYXO-CTERM domain-containing protein